MMKKYLMNGAAALTLCAAMTSCNHDFETLSQAQIDTKNYEAAFLNYVGGSIAADQDWGFGDNTTRGLTRSAIIGTTVATTNATLFDGWSDQKTYVTCDEEKTTLYQVTYSVDTNNPVSDNLQIMDAYLRALPEGTDNRARMNKHEFVTTEAGELSYVALPSITANKTDKVGYYYYTTSANIKTLHKYVLTNNLQGGIEQTQQYSDFNDANGQYLYSGRHYNATVYKLVYFDENGNASYTFPAGVNVGFFIENDVLEDAGTGATNTVEMYSNGEFNEDILDWLGDHANHDESWRTEGTTESHAIIFSSEGYNFVGFEDWTDYDYNDIVLSVYGNIKPADTVNNDDEDEEGEEQEEDDVYNLRIIAEDLSASQSSDFDFNDIVLDVKYGKPAKLRLMAAGGTLKLRINQDDNLEVHQLFNVPTEVMVNTYKNRHSEYKPVVIDSSKGFNVNIENAAQAKDLKLEVFKNGSWVEMKAERAQPASKIAVGTSFQWLDERQDIKTVYEGFTDWVKNNNNNQWWQSVTIDDEEE